MRFVWLVVFALSLLAAPVLAASDGATLFEAVGRIERGAEAWPPQAAKMSEAEALKASQAALGRVVRSGGRFIDHRGREATVEGARGKALVVSFIYTSCASVCPTITQSLERAVGEARKAFGGEDFEVWTVGFDTGFDTPEQMRRFAGTQGINIDNWRFLSGDLLSVVQMTDDLGFLFFRSAKGFDHLSQVTVIDKEGKVYRQVYGDSFDMPHLLEPLKEIVFDRQKSVFTAEGLAKRIKFFCTVYDPAKDRYIFDYSIFIEASAGIVVMSVPIWVLIRHVWRNRRRRPTSV